MKSLRVAILGMGLMGGSLAWALKNQVRALVAADPDKNTRDLVRSTGLVENIVENPGDILPESDVVILAAPVGAVLEIIPNLPDWHPGQAIVLDLGSTKQQICQQLEKLPPRFDVLGGHPICGNVVGGFEHADPDMFKGAVFAFSAFTHTTDQVKGFAEDLAERIGAKPCWVEPKQHDYLVSATSHLPYLLSAALALNTPQNSKPFRGPGYRSSTRLASTPSSMMLDVLKSNRIFLLQHLDQIQKILAEFERLIQKEKYPELLALMDQAADIKNETHQEV